jgi:hypothetical protein
VGSTDYWGLITIDTLRNSLVVPGEETRRKDHLLAAALERIPSQLEASRDKRESPESARTGQVEAAHSPQSRAATHRRAQSGGGDGRGCVRHEPSSPSRLDLLPTGDSSS